MDNESKLILYSIGCGIWFGILIGGVLADNPLVLYPALIMFMVQVGAALYKLAKILGKVIEA